MTSGRIFKRLLIGRTLSRFDFRHTLLPKILALPVFSSDPLSSNAYATQEILLVLGLVGTAALSLVIPISIAVALLLGTVVVSYRQTVRAYPSGGGAYIVAHENMGKYPGLLAAAALLIDYVLTVAVSIAAGVDAIVSAAPQFRTIKIPMALALVGFVTLVNLRGTKESGTLFAVPTYGFVVSVYVLLITGVVKCLDGCPLAESAGMPLESEHALTAFLVLKAFSAGTTALTGVEAISNGVPAFRQPRFQECSYHPRHDGRNVDLHVPRPLVVGKPDRGRHHRGIGEDRGSADRPCRIRGRANVLCPSGNDGGHPHTRG